MVNGTLEVKSGDEHSQQGEFISPGRAIARRFFRNPLGIIGLIVVLLFIVCALFAPWLAPHDPIETNLRLRLKPPTGENWLGTDELGRDLLSRLIYGARVSLLFGVLTTTLGATIGVTLGLLAGYWKGTLDNLIMRLVDLLLSFPGVLLAIAVVSVLGPGTGNALIAIAIGSIPIFARTTRVETLSVSQMEYVQAAHSLGASTLQVLWRHILPNTLAPIIVLVTLRMGTTILAASTLSFLGLGVQRPTPEWGAILVGGRDYLLSAPHMVIYPGIALSLVVIAFAVLGDALRDAVDPKLKDT